MREPIRVPESRHPLVVKLAIDLNAAGKLVKLGLRVSELRLAVFSASGRVQSFRLAVDVLRNGLLINVLPRDLSEVERYLGPRPAGDRIDRISIYGPARKYYSDSLEVEFLTIPEITLEPIEAALPATPAARAPEDTARAKVQPAHGIALQTVSATLLVGNGQVGGIAEFHRRHRDAEQPLIHVLRIDLPRTPGDIAFQAYQSLLTGAKAVGGHGHAEVLDSLPIDVDLARPEPIHVHNGSDPLQIRPPPPQ